MHVSTRIGCVFGDWHTSTSTMSESAAAIVDGKHSEGGAHYEKDEIQWFWTEERYNYTPERTNPQVQRGGSGIVIGNPVAGESR